MAYTLQIKRQETPITLKEWIHAVEATEGAKINESAISIINPHTGETISIAGHPGDTHVLLKPAEDRGDIHKSEWVHCFSYFQGTASFKVTWDTHDISHPVRTIAAALAHALQAQIIDDDGEVYNW
ncbi:hypothetical protein H0A36_26885 [Endozoicomonas sp. SM1973]|uniref:Uncharacterized protein n=1 Tax=Spartinivicinus marinus TaxID=2994442 RepID=A0A853IKP0_9GAMM|nr:hypothetical protein [Spartinivicinus marinus]MCX4030296.1 hypothetical protein [Spartinivicinus marinus]NYZ69645.1 hypothetical protein [Spartinivicinus marinus]